MISLWDSNSKARMLVAMFSTWWETMYDTCTSVCERAVKGRGIPLLPFSILSLFLYSYSNSISSLLSVCIWALMLWLFPFIQLSQLFELMGTVRAQVIFFAPHTIDLLVLAPELLPTLLPYIPKLVVHLEKLGPLIGKTLEYKDYVIPVIPGLLENMDYLVLLVDLLVPHFDKIAPHSEILFANFKLLIPHVDKVAAHADALVPFLEKEGWEVVLPHVNHLACHIDQLAPHAQYLLDDNVYEKLLDRIPVFAPYIGNLVPVVDELAPLLPELVQYIDLIPISVQREFLKSKSACRTLPAMVRAIPGLGKKVQKQSSVEVASSPHYPMPSTIGFTVKSTEKLVVGNDIVVFYRVILDSGGSRSIRYSSLRRFHKRLCKSVADRSRLSENKVFEKLIMPKFPKKSIMGRSLSEREIEKRKQELDVYLKELADRPLLLSLPIYQTFIQSFVVSSMIPAEYYKRIEEL